MIQGMALWLAVGLGGPPPPVMAPQVWYPTGTIVYSTPASTDWRYCQGNVCVRR